MGEVEEELKGSRALYLSGATQSVSDTIIDRFTGTIAVAAGATVAESGLINGGKQLALNLPQVIFGGLADSIGKKRVIIAGRLLGGVALSALAFVDAPLTLLVFIIAVSVTISMVTPAWGSLLGDYAGESRRGTIIGRINSVSQVGGLTAMVIALISTINQASPVSMTSFKPFLLLASASSFLSAILVSFTSERPPTTRQGKFDFSALMGDKRLRRFLLLCFIFGVGASTAMPFSSYITVGKLRMTLWQVSATAVANLACNVLSQRALGRTLDRLGRRPVLVFSRVAMASSCFVYAFATSWLHILAVEAFIGIALAAWSSGQSTYMIDLAPSKLRATYLAASMTAVGVSNFLGSYVMGSLSQGYIAATGYTGISMALILAGFLRFTLGFLFLTASEAKLES
jgi:MFS family permease